MLVHLAKWFASHAEITAPCIQTTQNHPRSSTFSAHGMDWNAFFVVAIILF